MLESGAKVSIYFFAAKNCGVFFLLSFSKNEYAP